MGLWKDYFMFFIVFVLDLFRSFVFRVIFLNVCLLGSGLGRLDLGRFGF